MTARVVRQRDLRVDFLRGLFILSLCGSHFTWFADAAGFTSPVRFYDIQPFGFSSPAEFFVFFSGYVLSLVLARNFAATGFMLTLARTIDRSWSLYVLNIFTFAIVVGLALHLFTASPALDRLTGLARLREAPLPFIGNFLIFRDNLAFFEILRNYIFFLPLIPAFLWLRRFGNWMPLAASATIWAMHQIGLTPDLSYATFDPFAWQLIFFLGATCAIIRPLTDWRFPVRGRQIMLCLALLLAFCIARRLIFPGITSVDLPFATKTDVGPLRVVHFALLLWTAMLLTPRSEILGRSRIVRAIVGVGQNSLECFCLSNVLIYAGGSLFAADPTSMPRYWIVLATIMLLMTGAAAMFTWFKSEPWRAAAALAPAPVPSPPPPAPSTGRAARSAQ